MMAGRSGLADGLEHPQNETFAGSRSFILAFVNGDFRAVCGRPNVIFRAGLSAIYELDKYLAGPAPWSIEGLLPDPRLDPIREDPRFVVLVKKYQRG